ncbi:MAG: RNA 2',3'-cyclic phosphodiesterase [Firmicutes bacterium]|nr:RNA 2',3'-cyclic phosphodiesterase [Bacillota bacterium]
MKTFIAMEFDRELKDNIGKIQLKLKDKSEKGSWVYVDNLHLTLKYLGNTTQRAIEDVKSVLGNIAKENKPLSFTLGELGFFPGRDILRVVYLNLDGETNELLELFKQVEMDMRNIGFSKERKRFKPHITLGRNILFDSTFYNIKTLIKKELSYNFKLKTITLMKSEYKEGKRIYTPIKKYNLKG